MTTKQDMSPSTRRAWIEIWIVQFGSRAPCGVALHPEGVDRNTFRQIYRRESRRVALHPEGVDRNPAANAPLLSGMPSPSTRRAWIEIALMFTFSIAVPRSPSTRRAWIEILRKLLLHLLFGVVALHPEGVDRNRHIEQSAKNGARRPPPGGRG